MKLNFKDEVKRFMFLEDRTFRSQYKEEAFREVYNEELRVEALYRN